VIDNNEPVDDMPNTYKSEIYLNENEPVYPDFLQGRQLVCSYVPRY
jgi:hypothetical protein